MRRISWLSRSCRWRVQPTHFRPFTTTTFVREKLGRKWLFIKGMVDGCREVLTFLLTEQQKPNIINSFHSYRGCLYHAAPLHSLVNPLGAFWNQTQ